MKAIVPVLAILILSFLVSAQSGRRIRQIVLPAPAGEPKAAPSIVRRDELPEVTAELHQDYRCSEYGGLARIMEAQETEPQVYSAKEVDARVNITSRPTPSYTKEARRIGVQGFVVLKAHLTADARVDRIRVIKRLPAGLTENAIRAACRIKFKPAIKDGEAVGQMVTVEYVFRLGDSSIFRPWVVISS